MRTLRFAVIGLRGMGRQHVKEIRSLPSAELAAVADTDEGLANTVGKEQGASVWNDYREMIDRTSLDAVVVATPHHLHGSMGLDCLQAGLHTFVEKPISNTVSEADRLVGESRDRGLKLAVGHNYRTFPGNRALKRLIDDGVLGEISRVCWMWLETRSESYYDRDIWRCTWEHAGGGVLMNQTSHDIDLLCWMLGDPVEVSAMISNWGHRAEIEDTVVANVRFTSGAHASLQFSTCDRRLNFRQLSGDLGTVVFQDEKNANSKVPDVFRLGRYEGSMRGFISGGGDAIAGQPGVAWEDVACPAGGPTLLESFVSAILDGGEAITDGASACRSLELINAMVLSGIRKEMVSFPLDRGRYDELMAELMEGGKAVFRHPR